MSRSYRCILFALVGWLVLAAAPPERSNAQTEQQQASGNVAQALNNIDATLNEATNPDVTAQPCRDGEDNRDSDLCAQWKAADAAQSGANATWLFGIVGSLIGGATLIAAIMAATYAKHAANAAGRANIHTERVMRQADRSSKAELRAYISFPDGFLEYSTLKALPQAVLTISNSGQTPAYDVVADGKVIVAKQMPEEWPRIDFRKRPRMVVGHGAPIPLRLFPGKQAAESGDMVFVFAEVRYTDIFKRRWQMRASYVSAGPIGSKDLVPCETGAYERQLKG